MAPRAIKLYSTIETVLTAVFKENVLNNIFLIFLCLALNWICGKAAILSVCGKNSVYFGYGYSNVCLFLKKWKYGTVTSL